MRAPPDPSELHRRLLAWFDVHKRPMPWRETTDPYAIWMSEVMLQQTQVATGLPYYLRWMARFPTVESLAAASEPEALKLWQGLGYYRRCRNLRLGAQRIVAEGWPKSAKEWQSIPGVGRYTAGAIASISLGEPSPVVDGNIVRLVSRLTANPNSGRALETDAWNWANANMCAERPGDWNQALMELGSTICTPRNPQCSICPLATCCAAHDSQQPGAFPVAAQKRQKLRLRREFQILTSASGEIAMRRAGEHEWWSGLWILPFGERSEAAEAENVGVVKFVVTRHSVEAIVTERRVTEPPSGYTMLPLEQLESVAIPAPCRKAIRLALRHGRLFRES